MLTSDDLRDIQARGYSPALIEEQLALFRRGFPYAHLVRPCTLGDGIRRLSSAELHDYIRMFEEEQRLGRATKFVPASGAATRMFKELLAFWQSIKTRDPDQPIHEFSPSSAQAALRTFFDNLTAFAFYPDLEKSLARAGFDCRNLLATGRIKPILDHLLFPTGLNYAHLPKALLPFHRYPDHVRTPIAEHVVEATVYTVDEQKTASSHFTVAPDHLEAVNRHIQELPQPITTGRHLDITLSVQKPSTDTIAVDANNEPFRATDGRLVFRPGGHGALLENLNDLHGDLVFIKNIDNVLPDRSKEPMYTYKKALGGLLIAVQRQVFHYLDLLETDRVSDAHMRDIARFATETLSLSLPEDWARWPKARQQSFFFARFNRPLRVCGMVPNTGEPGGGPFWVRHGDGHISLQIVESAQVDPASPDQQAILAAATHFNPVDMVCGVRDFRDRPFDLLQFRDPDAGLITSKSHEGRELKALEWPGLWNGGMAFWNTIFVEVPIEIFSPVKTILDLLRPEHRT